MLFTRDLKLKTKNWKLATKNWQLITGKKANVLLTAVIILSAFTLIVATGIALTAVDNLNIASDYISGDRVRSLADSCSQDARVQISRNPSYTGGTYAIEDGECSVAISSSGSITQLMITATLDEYVTEVEEVFDTSTKPYTIINWKRGF